MDDNSETTLGEIEWHLADPQQLGSLDPDAFLCSSCGSAGRSENLGGGRYNVTVVHAPDCLWMSHRHRRGVPICN